MLAPEILHDCRCLRQRELALAQDRAEEWRNANLVGHRGGDVACEHALR